MLRSLDGETRRLHDEDRLHQVMDTPILRCCQSQKQSDRFHARYQRKDFLEVEALALDKASGDEACLVLNNGAALVLLGLVHPLQADRTTSWRWIDELPSLIFLDRLHFLQHRPSSICIALNQREREW